MECGETDVFITFAKAKEARWKIDNAEIGTKTVIITLCPECNNASIFESIVRQMAKSV